MSEDEIKSQFTELSRELVGAATKDNDGIAAYVIGISLNILQQFVLDIHGIAEAVKTKTGIS